MARLSIDIEPREVALRVRVLGDEVRDGEELLECDAAVLRRCKGRRDLPPGLETATRRPPCKRVSDVTRSSFRPFENNPCNFTTRILMRIFAKIRVAYVLQYTRVDYAARMREKKKGEKHTHFKKDLRKKPNRTASS